MRPAAGECERQRRRSVEPALILSLRCFTAIVGLGLTDGGLAGFAHSWHRPIVFAGRRACLRVPSTQLHALRAQLYKADYMSDPLPDPDRTQGGWPGTGKAGDVPTQGKKVVGPHDVEMPALPVMTGSMFLGGKPLFPGALQVVSGAVLSPGQVHAVQCALAFAAVDDRLKKRPLVAYFGSVLQDERITGNIATLAEVEEVMTDEDGKLTSVSLAGVSRAVIPRIRQVRDKPLLVADKWRVYLDDIPESSYMHTLEKLRAIANQAMDQHEQRRKLSAQISAIMADLQVPLQGGTFTMLQMLARTPQPLNPKP